MVSACLEEGAVLSVVRYHRNPVKYLTRPLAECWRHDARSSDQGSH